MDRAGAANYLFQQVHANNTQRVEQMVKSGKLDISVIRYELYIPDMLEKLIPENRLALKLLQCDINSMSSFHYAAMMGYFDILVSFLDKNIEPDIPLESGTTALHLACFGGHLGTVKLLLNVYKVDVNKVDKYGWTGLHYASTEGCLEIIKLLIQHGANINTRDKDGTCAALRAQWQGHSDVVTYFCQIGDEDNLLSIEEGENSLKEEPAYAKIGPKLSKTPTASLIPSASFCSGKMGLKNNNSKTTSGQNVNSNKSKALQRSVSDIGSSASKAEDLSKSATLPTRVADSRHNRIRRVIRKELEAAFSDYANPISMQEGVGASSGKDEDADILMAGVGVNTMTKLMREEIQKYRDHIITPHSSGAAATIKEEHEDDYEGLYDTLKDFGHAPSVPVMGEVGGSRNYNPYVPPPLPPRNSDAFLNDTEDEINQMFKSMAIKGQPTSEALNAAIRKLGQILEGDWKKLARALPIDSNVSRVEDRIKRIEKLYLGNTEKQAIQALLDWRLQKGKSAEVDALILAMRKCGLHDKIEAMEKAASEFTA